MLKRILEKAEHFNGRFVPLVGIEQDEFDWLIQQAKGGGYMLKRILEKAEHFNGKFGPWVGIGWDEFDWLVQQAKRYEVIRRCTPLDFGEVWAKCMMGGFTFDEVIDSFVEGTDE